jgi:hypothetical protein
MRENYRKMKYENCYLSYANEFHFTVKQFGAAKDYTVSSSCEDCSNEVDSTILETWRRRHAV